MHLQNTGKPIHDDVLCVCDRFSYSNGLNDGKLNNLERNLKICNRIKTFFIQVKKKSMQIRYV